ncbi:MAG: DUF4268 domain-containing protein [Bacteroidales bacterium]|nr:DUF4268 domain-containing protein [Bacteroidales bacterium]
MGTGKLGKMERVEELRSIWGHEAHDFTPWIRENLDLLMNVVGIEMDVEEQESPVGDFRVDLLAKEKGSDRKIIIENQLEQTNHDHLGKLITYAAGKDAEIIIWIVKNAREEHRQAIQWLNQHTDDRFAFFLLEIELWKIDGSNPAPKFNVVERPNIWAKAIKSNSPGDSLKYEFWTDFKNTVDNDKNLSTIFAKKLPNPQPHYYYDIFIGVSDYHIALTASTENQKVISAGLYVSGDKEILRRFKEKEAELVKIFGSKIEWSAARFYVNKQFDITDKKIWKQGFEWLCEQCKNIKESLKLLEEPK